jgi:hypothetical protein
MKTKAMLNRLSIFSGLLLAIGAMLASGCHSARYKRGDFTAAKFQNAAQALQSESEALDATIHSLNELVTNPATDLNPQFESYNANLNTLVRSVEATDRAIVKLRQQSDEYFAAWDAEISAMNYEAVRNQSASRKSEVSSQVLSICQRYEEAQNVVKPLINYFQDIQKALGTDLTTAGLMATRNIVANASENTRRIQTALAQLTSEMSASGIQLSSTNAGDPSTEVLQKTSDSRADAANHE